MAPAVLFFLAFVVLVIVLGVFSHHQAKKRREALSARARSRGWRFIPDRDRDHDNHFAHFRAFQAGNSRYAYNTFFGHHEILGGPQPFKMGEFHYATQSTDSKGKTKTDHHYFSYLLLQTPFPNLPTTTIRPEGFFDKVGAFFGFDDIDFESAEFSRKFHVSGEDKRFAYDIVHPRVMEFLLATRGPTIALSREHVCVTCGGVWKEEEYERYLDWTAQFLDHWPRHVAEDLRSRME